ncbi:MAG: PAS domain-containing protein [Spirochaetes bacterium]|nr:PAS domain-containing protein [Spirochaetota bacterium]
MNNILPKTILLVEDEVVIAAMERQLLENEGYTVIHAVTGEESVAVVREEKTSVDLILMDIELGGGIDGAAAAEEIHRFNSIPVVFLSSRMEKDTVAKTGGVASYGYILKNAGIDVLLASVRMALRLVDVIAERTAVETKLKDSLAKLDAAQGVAKIGFWELDLADMTITWSKGVMSIFGLPPDSPSPTLDEFQGFVHPDDRVFVEAQVKKQLRPMDAVEITYMYRIIAKDGSVKSIDHRGRQKFSSDGRLVGIYGSVQDITEQYHAAVSLRESEERHRRLFETMTQGIVYQNAEGAIISANPAAERILGLTVSQMMGKTSMDPDWKAIREDGSELPGKDHPAMVALRTGRTEGPFTMGVYHPKTKSHSWISVTAVPFFQPGETSPGMVYTTFDDITERKRANEAMRASDERYAVTLAALNDGIWDWNVPSGTAYFSPRYYAILGFDDGAFPATYTGWRALVHPDDIVRVEGDLARSTGSGAGFSIDLRMKTKAGGWCWVSTRGKVIEHDAEGRAVRMVGTLSDITERKHAEEALLHADKLASLGILATGIAHEVNQPLMAISMALDILSVKGGGDAYTADKIASMKGYVQRITRIVDQVRAYAREQNDGATGTFSVNDCVDNVMNLLGSQYRVLGIDLAVVRDPAVPLSRGDIFRFEQVVINLLTNAKHAVMEQARGKPRDWNRKIGIATANENGSAVLRVRDNGIGIPDSVRRNLFSPFFTTKPPGEGTGLGLSITYSIIQSMGGEISVDSPGDHTEFIVRLPPVT